MEKPVEHKHTLTEHAAQRSNNCQTEGTIQYWECTSCKKKFSDPAGRNEISDISDHTKGPHTYNEMGICTTCNYVGPDHHHVWHDTGVTTPATCVQSGTKEQKCDGCGQTQIVENPDAPATGVHNFVDGKCSVCGADDPNYNPGGGDDTGGEG